MVDDPAFWRKVSIGNDCWEWQGATSKGYGHLMRRQKHPTPIRAHRYAIDYWGSQCVMHSCDNPLCVRPSHLRAASIRENNQDCAAKGRSRNQHSGQPLSGQPLSGQPLSGQPLS